MGCRVEALQLTTRERLEPALVLYLIIAWRVQYLMILGRACPDLPCEVAFAPEEWQVAYIVGNRQAPPPEPPPLGEKKWYHFLCEGVRFAKEKDFG